MEKDKGQNKEINNLQSNSSAFWNGSESYNYTYKKTEKIVTALYMVTNFLDMEEPIKWKIRKLGNSLLSLVVSLKDKFSNQRDETIHLINSSVLELVSLLDISQYAGLMSFMNAELLKLELTDLVKKLLENQEQSSYSKTLVLQESFFNSSNNHVGSREDFGKLKLEKRELFSNRDKTLPHSDQAYSKGQIIRRHSSEHTDTAEKKENRRKIIIELLKKKGTITIKDVSQIIKNCSEKTIQRELLSLVGENVLKKEGERRWSHYTLAKV